MKRIIVLALLWLVSLTALAADDKHRDGNYWRGMSETQRTSFIVGFFGTIGMYLIQVGWHRA